MKQKYKHFQFHSYTLKMIALINSVLEEYQAAGYVLTVRQLYYQLVARGLIENNERSYKRVISIVNDGRLAGMIDWDIIEDRTREFIVNSHWTSGASILRSAANSFNMDRWENQECRVFVIVEKEALAGILQRICSQYDVPLLAARGYPSVTVVREFVESQLNDNGKQNVILHLGDHDPSGIDMSRDLQDRFNIFRTADTDINFRRIALNYDQIEEQRPPPNPAKFTDSRIHTYVERFGTKSWELDALKPEYLVKLVKDEITSVIDYSEWDKKEEQVETIRGTLNNVATKFNGIVDGTLKIVENRND